MFEPRGERPLRGEKKPLRPPSPPMDATATCSEVAMAPPPCRDDVSDGVTRDFLSPGSAKTEPRGADGATIASFCSCSEITRSLLAGTPPSDASAELASLCVLLQLNPRRRWCGLASGLVPRT